MLFKVALREGALSHLRSVDRKLYSTNTEKSLTFNQYMRLNLKFFFYLVLLFTLATAPHLRSQQLEEIQFINQPITDILLALGEISGKSIIPDETIQGSASYYFSETDFETAFEVFLKTYKMYYKKEDDVYYVSRIRAEYDFRMNAISMDAEDVDFPLLVRAASKAIDKTILYDPLPSVPLTVHVSRVSPEKFLTILLKRFPNYQVEVDQDYYYVKKIPTQPSEIELAKAEAALKIIEVEKQRNRYSITLEKGRFKEIIDELFLKAGYEYILLTSKDSIVENLRYEDKSFSEILRLVLDQASADFTRIGGVYYIFEIQQRDILKKLHTTVKIPLTYISAAELSNLFPAGMVSGQIFKIDPNTNSIILSGSLEEITPVQDFIKKIDQPVENQQYFRFNVNYLDIKEITSLIPPALKHIEPIVIPGTNSFIALLPEEKKETLEDYLQLIDIPAATVSVKLKYIKAEDLLQKLPPSISKEEIVETGDPTIVFLKTSSKKVEDFLRELRVLDKPIPQIRYQLLVIQYTQGESIEWSDSLESSLTQAGAQTAFLGTIGQLLSLNFDIVSTFGYQFALKLNTELDKNKARVLADTTLLGLSNEDISFQNTETYRYHDIEIDEEGNTIITSIVREIVAGLFFNIKGWASGDSMITMEVEATVSKRGTVPTSVTGTIPSTSENVIKTRARTFSGRPVVISGLIRQEQSTQITKVPILGSIPILGYLFQAREEKMENSEIVIYIVPHVVHEEIEEASLNSKLERIYYKLLRTEHE